MALHPHSGFARPFGPGISGFAYDTTNPSPAWSTVTGGETVVVTPTNAPSTTNVTPKSSKKNSTGVIVGGLLGGLTFIALLIVALIFYRRRRHRTYPSPTPLIHDLNYTQPSRRNEKFVQVLQEQDETHRWRAQLQTAVEERNGGREGSTRLQIELLSQRSLAVEAQQRELDDRERGSEAPPDYSS